MLEILFSSRARVEILKLFLFNPKESLYQRQISLRTHQSIRGVQREVDKLERIGLIEKSSQGNRIYYRINNQFPILNDLKNIFFKSIGIAEALKVNLLKHDAVDIAFIFGSYAKNEENLSSDIDLFVIGSITLKELSKVLSNQKRELGREINYMVFRLNEIRERINKKDNFLKTVLLEKKIFIIGSENELKTIIESGKTKTP